MIFGHLKTNWWWKLKGKCIMKSLKKNAFAHLSVRPGFRDFEIKEINTQTAVFGGACNL